ncbi:hypothetical protein GCM10010525_07180 [Glutamicibacter bergerei]
MPGFGIASERLFGGVLACGNSDPTVIGEKVAGQDIFIGILRLATVADELLHLVAELIYLVVFHQCEPDNTVSEGQGEIAVVTFTVSGAKLTG